MTQIILDLQEVVKDYDKKRAVDKVSFQLPKGAIFGLLGPNGAGKTSLIRIITSITRADAGVVLFNGEPLQEKHSERMGYMPEERGLYKKMKIGDHLLYLAQLKGLSYKEAKTIMMIHAIVMHMVHMAATAIPIGGTKQILRNARATSGST